ncbi:acetyltransferase [Fibrella aestuarina BUZ 2]|uniref:Acetyltransferase n=1 Tax=Fibrella aestuarina BUZ 2 TaxID=1166018 RepID=I0KDP3_9BACT|nr:GNAT family N-acetyltransferase [Fibrella aestuarina]CCH02246.1 acetyltransferase [Fibrella aestuarina BUZ 2]
MIETPRLMLLPLSLEQVRLHIAGGTRLEEAMGVRPGHREVTEPLLSILRHFTIPFLQNPGRQSIYDTLWIALDTTLNQFVADAKFKGMPDEEQTVEIGYGTYPAFQRRGYMTEIVGAMTAWALSQPNTHRVVAETALDNTASQTVLLNNGFRPFEQDERVRWWERLGK